VTATSLNCSHHRWIAQQSSQRLPTHHTTCNALYQALPAIDSDMPVPGFGVQTLDGANARAWARHSSHLSHFTQAVNLIMAPHKCDLHGCTLAEATVQERQRNCIGMAKLLSLVQLKRHIDTEHSRLGEQFAEGWIPNKCTQLYAGQLANFKVEFDKLPVICVGRAAAYGGEAGRGLQFHEQCLPSLRAGVSACHRGYYTPVNNHPEICSVFDENNLLNLACPWCRSACNLPVVSHSATMPGTLFCCTWMCSVYTKDMSSSV
jgi:hypothetical protein